MFFNRKQKSLQKEIAKLKENYKKGNSLVILGVDPEFKFEKPDWEW